MRRVIALCLLSFFVSSLHAQKVERWKGDGFIYEIVEDTATIRPSCCTTLRIGFLGDFYRDNIKVKMKRHALVDTIVSTRNEQGVSESDNSAYTSEIRIKNCCSKSIDFILNKKHLQFAFKKGYSIIYFSFYDEKTSNGSSQIVYSVTYTNEFFKRL